MSRRHLCLVRVHAEALRSGRAYKFTATQANWIFSIGLLVFSFTIILSGRIMGKTGPRKLAVASAIVLGAGYILGGFFGGSFFAQLILIGIVGGFGIGLGYAVPIPSESSGSPTRRVW